jgi:FAD:protein FMN transferase
VKAGHPRPHIIDRDVWGTVIRLDVRDPVAEQALDEVWTWFRHIDDLFSTWRDDSEISRLAGGALTMDATSPEVPVVLAHCERIRVLSGGAFDIAFAAQLDGSKPGRCAIDPSGFVKGWAVDRAAELLRALGAENFAINAGGDVLACGRPEAGGVWRVGIQHPWQRDKTAEIVGVTNAAVATSGNYERGDHVFDPHTRQPAHGLVSVTVIADELATADGYATAAMAMGPDGMEWLAGLDAVHAAGITDAQRIVKTSGFDAFVVR